MKVALTDAESQRCRLHNTSSDCYLQETFETASGGNYNTFRKEQRLPESQRCSAEDRKALTGRRMKWAEHVNGRGEQWKKRVVISWTHMKSSCVLLLYSIRTRIVRKLRFSLFCLYEAFQDEFTSARSCQTYSLQKHAQRLPSHQLSVWVSLTLKFSLDPFHNSFSLPSLNGDKTKRSASWCFFMCLSVERLISQQASVRSSDIQFTSVFKGLNEHTCCRFMLFCLFLTVCMIWPGYLAGRTCLFSVILLHSLTNMCVSLCEPSSGQLHHVSASPSELLISLLMRTEVVSTLPCEAASGLLTGNGLRQMQLTAKPFHCRGVRGDSAWSASTDLLPSSPPDPVKMPT